MTTPAAGGAESRDMAIRTLGVEEELVLRTARAWE